MILYRDEICAKALFDLNVPFEDIERTEYIFNSCDELKDVLSSPSVSRNEKYAVIDKIFPDSVKKFLKVMVDFNRIGEIADILESYRELDLTAKNILNTQLSYVNKPDDETVASFKEMLKKKYNASDVELILKQDDSLIGGYKLTVGDIVYDKSVQGAVKALQNRLIRR
ncbi:MAG: ATP synthase F1 subunit delta [Hominimerdicola sp.]